MVASSLLWLLYSTRCNSEIIRQRPTKTMLSKVDDYLGLDPVLVYLIKFLNYFQVFHG